MSLLDDVSIVVTPNGYKAGELYAVVPVPTEGSEEVTDGNFPSPNTSWSLSGWEILGNLAKNSVDGAGNNLYQGSVTSVNQLFKVVITATITAGSVKVMLGGGTGGYNEIGEATSTGTFTYYGTSFGTDNRILLQTGTGSVIGSVQLSNISVKEYTSADMDVTRETAATRVDEDGLVNYAEVLGSEEVTDGNFPSPNTAWDLSPTFTIADNKLHCVSDGSYQYANQSAMVVGKTYRITFDITGWVSGSVRVRPSGQSPFQSAGSNGSYIFYYTAVSNSTLTIERNGTPTDLYIENISVKEVTRDNVPRIDYTGGGCPHILAEPERRNLALNSETFSSYNTDNVNISSSSTLSPDGVSTAIKLALDNGTLSSNGGMSFVYSSTAGETLSWSMFVKKAEYRYLTFSFGSGNAVGFHFDLDTGLTTQDLTNTQYTLIENKIESYNNGWYRISVSLIDLTGSANRYVSVKPSPVLPTASNNNYSSTGDGTSGVYVWGGQLEEGSYPTSYIPTSGSTVTRNQDIFTRDGIGSLINSTEGVLFVEMAALSDDLSFRSISLNDGDFKNSVGIRYRTDSNKINAIIKDDNGVTFQMNFEVSDITQFNKIALKYKSGDNSLYINGTEVSTNSSTFSFTSALNDVSFNRGDGNDKFFGKVKQLQVYNTALGGSPYDATLSDARLAALTSS